MTHPCLQNDNIHTKGHELSSCCKPSYASPNDNHTPMLLRCISKNKGIVSRIFSLSNSQPFYQPHTSDMYNNHHSFRIYSCFCITFTIGIAQSIFIICNVQIVSKSKCIASNNLGIYFVRCLSLRKSSKYQPTKTSFGWLAHHRLEGTVNLCSKNGQDLIFLIYIVHCTFVK